MIIRLVHWSRSFVKAPANYKVSSFEVCLQLLLIRFFLILQPLLCSSSLCLRLCRTLFFDLLFHNLFVADTLDSICLSIIDVVDLERPQTMNYQRQRSSLFHCCSSTVVLPLFLVLLSRVCDGFFSCSRPCLRSIVENFTRNDDHWMQPFSIDKSLSV